jgi:hypothetical protein
MAKDIYTCLLFSSHALRQDALNAQHIHGIVTCGPKALMNSYSSALYPIHDCTILMFN